MKYLALLFVLLLATSAGAQNIERGITSTVEIQSLIGRTFCSGTIVKGTGLILSAWHCFDNGGRFRIRGAHGTYFADVIESDELNDIAILHPTDMHFAYSDGVPLSKRPAIPGEQVFAIGHPQVGQLFKNTVLSGVLSYWHRQLKDKQHFTQASIPIIRGMSGGGFYNSDGELLGASLFGWIIPTHCRYGSCNVFQDSSINGFSYLPLVYSALTRAIEKRNSYGFEYYH